MVEKIAAEKSVPFAPVEVDGGKEVAAAEEGASIAAAASAAGEPTRTDMAGVSGAEKAVPMLVAPAEADGTKEVATAEEGAPITAAPAAPRHDFFLPLLERRKRKQAEKKQQQQQQDEQIQQQMQQQQQQQQRVGEVKRKRGRPKKGGKQMEAVEGSGVAQAYPAVAGNKVTSESTQKRGRPRKGGKQMEVVEASGVAQAYPAVTGDVSAVDMSATPVADVSPTLAADMSVAPPADVSPAPAADVSPAHATPVVAFMSSVGSPVGVGVGRKRVSVMEEFSAMEEDGEHTQQQVQPKEREQTAPVDQAQFPSLVETQPPAAAEALDKTAAGYGDPVFQAAPVEEAAQTASVDQTELPSPAENQPPAEAETLGKAAAGYGGPVQAAPVEAAPQPAPVHQAQLASPGPVEAQPPAAAEALGEVATSRYGRRLKQRSLFEPKSVQERPRRPGKPAAEGTQKATRESLKGTRQNESRGPVSRGGKRLQQMMLGIRFVPVGGEFDRGEALVLPWLQRAGRGGAATGAGGLATCPQGANGSERLDGFADGVDGSGRLDGTRGVGILGGLTSGREGVSGGIGGGVTGRGAAGGAAGGAGVKAAGGGFFGARVMRFSSRKVPLLPLNPFHVNQEGEGDEEGEEERKEEGKEEGKEEREDQQQKHRMSPPFGVCQWEELQHQHRMTPPLPPLGQVLFGLCAARVYGRMLRGEEGTRDGGEGKEAGSGEKVKEVVASIAGCSAAIEGGEFAAEGAAGHTSAAVDTAGATGGAGTAAGAASDLWSRHYQPTSPAEICGNEAAVNELLQWLTLWQGRLGFTPVCDAQTHAHAAAADIAAADGAAAAVDAADAGAAGGIGGAPTAATAEAATAAAVVGSFDMPTNPQTTSAAATADALAGTGAVGDGVVVKGGGIGGGSRQSRRARAVKQRSCWRSSDKGRHGKRRSGAGAEGSDEEDWSDGDSGGGADDGDGDTERDCSGSEYSAESDYNEGSDSDGWMEEEEGEQLPCAVLLTGPVGSGKTAAAYACASSLGFQVVEVNASGPRPSNPQPPPCLFSLVHQSGKTAAAYACASSLGFQVVEVNASDARDGALLRGRFSELLFSHRLSANHAVPQPKLSATYISLSSSLPSLPSSARLFASPKSFIDPKPNLPSTLTRFTIPFETPELFPHLLNPPPFPPLPCFFASSPLFLAAPNPNLPTALTRFIIPFARPSAGQAMPLLHKICTEQAPLSAPPPLSLLSLLLSSLPTDLRSLLLFLQFWLPRKSTLSEEAVAEEAVAEEAVAEEAVAEEGARHRSQGSSRDKEGGDGVPDSEMAVAAEAVAEEAVAEEAVAEEAVAEEAVAEEAVAEEAVAEEAVAEEAVAEEAVAVEAVAEEAVAEEAVAEEAVAEEAVADEGSEGHGEAQGGCERDREEGEKGREEVKERKEEEENALEECGEMEGQVDDVAVVMDDVAVEADEVAVEADEVELLADDVEDDEDALLEELLPRGNTRLEEVCSASAADTWKDLKCQLAHSDWLAAHRPGSEVTTQARQELTLLTRLTELTARLADADVISGGLTCRRVPLGLETEGDFDRGKEKSGVDFLDWRDPIPYHAILSPVIVIWRGIQTRTIGATCLFLSKLLLKGTAVLQEAVYSVV
ncbi:unnamed protein product [Closterium sp. Naga37s-1]|nr:unnamed protein product [Closterium sp. Naga37s-1]